MNINIKVDRDFERCLDDLKKKYGEAFEYINGLHPSQLDFSEFIDKFVVKDTLADASIDPNANAYHKDIRSFMTEKGKSEDKLFALSKIFSTMKKQWGLRTAKEWLEQEFSKGFYLNDSTTASYFPYCWANDFTRLATEGLFFLNPSLSIRDHDTGEEYTLNYNNQPPKHLTTFFDDVIEFVSFLSNRQSGAVGMPNILIWAWYFWKKDVEDGYYMKDPDYYLRQNMEKLIYRLNQPFLRIDQSSFTNVSIFDHPYMEALFGGVIFPDGTMAIDHIDELVECQKVFMEVVSKTRDTNMFTYPVITYSLLYYDGRFADETFARWCSYHNMRWNDANFFVSDNVGVLSNCPVSGDTQVMYYVERYRSWKRCQIKDVYHNRFKRKQGRYVTMLSNGAPVKVRINQFSDPIEYKITLQNGAELKTTAHHLNKVYGRDYVETVNLTENDYLPFGRHPYESSTNLNYQDGFFVGMFLGDGSYKNKTDVTFSLSKPKDELIQLLHDYCPKHFGATVTEDHITSSLSGKQSCTNVNVLSGFFRGLIEQFVIGEGAIDKGINGKALEQSFEFRQGILDGLYATDGGNSGRIYTSSQRLKDDLVMLCASLGRVTTVSVDTRDGRLGTNPCYTVRLYSDDTTRMKQKDIYIKEEDYFWVKIKSIEKIENGPKVSYCVEVLDEEVEPIFTLGNGIITHNCRLLSDTSKLDAFINSIGGTALSVGSCRVSTINLVRIAYECGFEKEKYIEILKERVLLDCKALTSMRHIIKRNIEKGLLPNYQDGAVELDKQFCTIGGIGMYEVMDLFGLINTDEFGNKSYSDEAVDFATKILNTMNQVKDNFECDFSFNIEMIPAENCAGVICQADNLLFEQDKYFIYSNQWIPLMEPCTIQEKCRLGSLFDKMCGGGCIAHINVENRFPNEEVAWEMLNYVASHGVIYFAFTTKINVCKHRHAFIGSQTCPQCGEPIADTYARVVG